MSKIPIEDLRKIPVGLGYLPKGTRVFPACSIYPDKEGWIILPPEECLIDEETFSNWKDQLYNGAIE